MQYALIGWLKLSLDPQSGFKFPIGKLGPRTAIDKIQNNSIRLIYCFLRSNCSEDLGLSIFEGEGLSAGADVQMDLDFGRSHLMTSGSDVLNSHQYLIQRAL